MSKQKLGLAVGLDAGGLLTNLAVSHNKECNHDLWPNFQFFINLVSVQLHNPLKNHMVNGVLKEIYDQR